MSRGKGTSGFSPVSMIGIFAFLISFSTNPAETALAVLITDISVSDSYPNLHLAPAAADSFTSYSKIV